MWLSENKKWNKLNTQLENFLTERIIQRCDYEEVLSNQHRTANGYTLIHELLKLALLSRTRGRTVRTLMVLFEEAKSIALNQSVVNDPIICKYFTDIRKYFEKYETHKLIDKDKQPELNVLNQLIHQLTLFTIQLEKGYFDSLTKEFYLINYKDSSSFQRNADEISSLIDLLIPFLVFKGYAVSSLSDVLKSWIHKNYNITVKRMFLFFNLKNRNFEFLIKVTPAVERDLENIIDLLGKEVNAEITCGLVKDLSAKFDGLEIFKEEDKVIIYNNSNYLDTHNHFRSVYDRLLKRLVLQRERQSLELFNAFFSSCYWRIPKKNKFYHNVSLVNDPINVQFRGRTLIETIVKSADGYGYIFDEKTKIPELQDSQLNSSLYYYNLALGSKSIENSLSLLWTSLEALLPYRLNYSDIECVQSFVSKSLCLGSINRDIIGFATRVIQTNEKTNQSLNGILTNPGLTTSMKSMNKCWFDWISDINDNSEKFKTLQKQSNLLAYEYCRIGKPLTEKKLKYLSERIEKSNLSISYQLQRIYLHRNQIIHAGNLINEYTNLWMHLEWYVGKLLAYSIIQLELIKSKSNITEVFTELESDYEYIKTYLDMNKEKPIPEISTRIKKMILEYNWQSF